MYPIRAQTKALILIIKRQYDGEEKIADIDVETKAAV